MKILEVTCWLPEGGMGGGGTVVCLDNALALSRLGADVRIFAGDYSGTHERLTARDDHSGEVPITRLSLESWDRHTPLWRKHNPDAAAAFGRHLDERRPDVVHFHSLQGLGFNCLDEAVKRGVPSAVTLHDYWWVSPLRFMTNLRTGHIAWGAGWIETLRCRAHRRVHPAFAGDLMPFPGATDQSGGYGEFRSVVGEFREAVHTFRASRKLLAHAHALISPSQFLLNVYRRCGLQKFVHIPNGAPAATSSIARRDSSDGPLRFGLMCGLDVWKGTRRAIRAIREFTPESAELWIWGAKEPPTESEANGPNIRWMGRLPAERRHEAHAHMDVFLALSLRHENAPLATIEAQAAKTPVIATDVGGHPELIHDGVDGFLVSREDFAALKGAMQRIVDDRALVIQMSANSPVRASEQEVMGQLMALLLGLAEGKRA